MRMVDIGGGDKTVADGGLDSSAMARISPSSPTFSKTMISATI
jgi:hypothetical protein